MLLGEFQRALAMIMGPNYLDHQAKTKLVPVAGRGTAISAEVHLLTGRLGSLAEVAARVGNAKGEITPALRSVLIANLGGVLGIVGRMAETLDVPFDDLAKRQLEELHAAFGALDAPVPMRLACPQCGQAHTCSPRGRFVGETETCRSQSGGGPRPAAEGEHVCWSCGNIWEPYTFATVGEEK